MMIADPLLPAASFGEEVPGLQDFLDSPEARHLDPDPFGADASRVEALRTGVAPGRRRLAWTPRTVATLMLDWWPQHARDAEDPHRLLTVLRALVLHAQATGEIPRRVGIQTVAVIEALECDFLDRLTMMVDSWPPDRRSTPLSPEESRLRDLARVVGGAGALLSLDPEPLPDEPLALDRVPEDLVELVRRLSGMVESAVAELFDVEARTACRRVLARLAEVAPEVLRRRAREINTAAGVAWAVGQANGLVGYPPAPWRGKDLAAAFGMVHLSHRGQTILRSLGDPCGYRFDSGLGSPALLVGGRRRRIVEERDQLIAAAADRGIEITAEGLDADPVPVWPPWQSARW